MSTTFAQAYEAVRSSIGEGMRITSASEGAAHWFFGIGDSLVDSIPDGSPAVVSKETGEIGYPMPSVPSDLLGEPLLPIEIEAESAVEVPLPE